MRLAHLTVLLCAGCSTAPDTAAPDAPARASWRGSVEVQGALRAMFHEGQTGAAVSLDSLLPNPDLYAVGALADLSGEITVVDGMAYLSRPGDPEGARTEATGRPTGGAALLVSSEVAAWRAFETEYAIRFEDLDEAIAHLARTAGIPPGERFPFLVEGEVEDLRWHVIDGRRLEAGGTSHEDHLAASVRAHAPRTRATLIGFYSETDQGVFTHMGSRTHVHCVIPEPLASGHVDHVTIPAGATIRLPDPAGPPLEAATADARAAVSAAWREHIDAAVRKDVEAVVRIYDDDVLYVVTGMEPVHGRAAIDAMEAKTLASADVLHAEHTTQNLRVYRDVAYELGTVIGPVRPEGGAAGTVTFHFMATWRRQPDGSWRIWRFVGQPE